MRKDIDSTKISVKFRKHCCKCNYLCCRKGDVTFFASELENIPHKNNSLIFMKHWNKININVKRVSLRNSCHFLDVNLGCSISYNLRPLDCILYPIYPIIKYSINDGKEISGMMIHKSCPFAVEISKDKILVKLLKSLVTNVFDKFDNNDIKCWFGSKRNYWLDKNVIKVDI